MKKSKRDLLRDRMKTMARPYSTGPMATRTPKQNAIDKIERMQWIGWVIIFALFAVIAVTECSRRQERRGKNAGIQTDGGVTFYPSEPPSKQSSEASE